MWSPFPRHDPRGERAVADREASKVLSNGTALPPAFRVIVLTIHRGGKNVRDKLLQRGEILLILDTEQAVNELRGGNELILFNRPLLGQKRRITRDLTV